MKWKLCISCSILFHITQYSSVSSLEGSNIRNVKENEYSFAVSLSHTPSYSKSKKNNHFCGGTLITKRHVLTAKHCLDEESINDIQVMTRPLSRIFRNKKPKFFSVKSAITYEGWAKDHGKPPASCLEDIAILELDTDDTKIKPASYPVLQDPVPGSDVVMVGYDVTKNAVSPPVTKATLTMLSNQDCVDRLKKYVQYPDKLEVNEYLMCTNSEPWTLATPGDSGAPVMNETGYLVGIHTAICPCWSVCPDKSVPINLAIRIRYYLDFIADSTISNNLSVLL